MNKKNTEYLFTTYPILYRGKDMSIEQNLMPFGFECGDGWFEIIKELSEKIEGRNQHAAAAQPTIAVQVKEKFGALRFYEAGGNEEIYGWIEEAERKSSETCELCGKKGKLRGTVWFKTLCDECSEKENCR